MSEHKKWLYQKGLRLEYFTISYNLVEGTICIIYGLLAGSVALIGFGLDSFVESISACILVWRLKASAFNITHENEMERKAIKFIACSFFILSTYISFEACRKLYFHEIPESSPVGIVMTMLSLLIMPVLAQQKYKIGKALNSRALVADSKETVACCFLSGIVLMGLLLNYYWGLWWADPIASLVVVAFLVKEGRELLKNEDEDLD